jgi:hypothetical protein
MYVSRLSRYTHKYGIEHCDAISKLLKYLESTVNFGLLHCGYPTILKGFCNTN